MESIALPNMLLIGAAGRNVGKTELACRVISNLASAMPVIAVKVTTVDERRGACPQGGDGCGVCSSLDGAWDLREETDGPPGKDTTRMRRAGATRVLWLRVLRDRLPAAAAALAEAVGSSAPVVCESNSLRQALVPGRFLMVRRQGVERYKRSAEEVRRYVDCTIEFDGESLAFAPRRLTYAAGAWQLRYAATGIVLAGGGSRRMGRDKCLLPVADKTLIEHVKEQLQPCVDEVLISAGAADRFSDLGVRVVPDEAAGCGPLMGIVSALQASRSDVNAVVACDIPRIDRRLLGRLIDALGDGDGVVPVSNSTRCEVEPLFAVYHRRLLPHLRRALAAGTRKVVDALADRRIRRVPLGAGAGLINLNTPEDYRRFIASSTAAEGQTGS